MGNQQGKAMMDKVGAVFQAWGTGKFKEDKDNSLKASLMTEDVVVDSTALVSDEKYKIYTGFDGFDQWLTALEEFEFADFTPKIQPCREGDDSVKVVATFKITKKSTGKKGEGRDLQEWFFKDGKICKVKFYWGDQKMVQELHSSETNDDLAVVGELFQSWGTGLFSAEGKEELAKKLIHEDAVFNAASNIKNTDGFKNYTGHDGFFQWIDFLTTFDFQNFTPVFTPAQGKVIVQSTYQVSLKATGKAAEESMHDMHEWIMKDGKIARVNFYWGNPEAFDKMYETESAKSDGPSDLEIVGAVFQAWGTGQFAGPDAKSVAEKYFSKDCVSDASGHAQNTDMYKTYNGPEGVLEWVNNLDQFEYKDFTPTFSTPGEGLVYVRASYNLTNKATGRSVEGATDMHQWTVKDGKVTHVQFYFDDLQAIDQTFNGSLATVQGAFQEWGAGKFDASTAEKFFAEDAVTDAAAATKNTDMYKVYNGREGVLEWVKNLATVEYKDFTPTFSQHGDQVFVKATYTAVHQETKKSTDKTQTDSQIWTVKNGKVTHVKFYFGDVAALDALFATE